MKKDIRASELYKEAEALYRSVRKPGSGQISDATDLHVSLDGQRVAFTGSMLDELNGSLQTRICQLDLASGDFRIVTFGPNTDRLPKFSPRGDRIAFLSDRHEAGDFQLYILDCSTGGSRPGPHVGGWIEYLHWSPDGERILLGVAGHGADTAGGQGAITTKAREEASLQWMPTVQGGVDSGSWRRAWVYEVRSHRVGQVSHEDLNVWEAAWCGNDALAVVTSPGPGEGLWYTAKLGLIDLASRSYRQMLVPQDQLGWATGSPSGNHIAIVEAVGSDRGLLAGDLRLVETSSGKTIRIDTNGVDVSHAEFRSDDNLLLAGHRGFETVVSLLNLTSGKVRDVWVSQYLTTGGYHTTVAGFNEPGDCVLVGENFVTAPEIATIRGGVYTAIRSLDVGYSEQVKAIDGVDRVSWKAPDGLELQGWLLRPRGPGPYPLIMSIHGGPVWQSRPVWLGRRAVSLLMVQHGYAVFLPNPRGSTGRGQEFAHLVKGDMAGADTYDYLSGLDFLVTRGIADPKRLGVTGISYGGFMTSWLITQDQRFAAAVPVSPITNHVTEHLLSNIPHFVALFLGDQYNNVGGKYFSRSPLMYAQNVKTPTLNICGALDRCTPPTEAAQFHSALLENGTRSVLVTYPQEGHGVRAFPAAIDYAARVVAWFEEHMPASGSWPRSPGVGMSQ